jgi:putative PIN family toxin of toxin-antitoxin system
VRIVIDTNIWVSGLLWQGDAWKLLTLADEGHLEICIAYPMLLELEEVLAYDRLQNRLATLQETPAQLAAYALSISSLFNISRSGPPIVNEDPDDDIFLLCAVAAEASFVVTNDKHLLALGSYEGIPIVKIEDFWQERERKMHSPGG